jgi:hypothetical protein
MLKLTVMQLLIFTSSAHGMDIAAKIEANYTKT